MKEIILICTLLGQLWSVADCRSAGVKAQQPVSKQSALATGVRGHDWHAATYRGLRVGKSTSADMLRVFGKPHWSGPPGDQTKDDPNPEVWNEYEAGGDFPGKLTVVVDKRSRIIQRIDLYPENLSKEQAIKHFGDGYITTRYDFDECLSDGESAPIYESPNGQFVSIEYRDRGVAVSLGHGERVDTISYVKGPIGATISRCKGRRQ
jgi:hypothetical protein